MLVFCAGWILMRSSFFIKISHYRVSYLGVAALTSPFIIFTFFMDEDTERVPNGWTSSDLLSAPFR